MGRRRFLAGTLCFILAFAALCTPVLGEEKPFLTGGNDPLAEENDPPAGGNDPLVEENSFFAEENGVLAGGDTLTWTGEAGDGSWHNAGNWDLERVPVEGDCVIIPESEEVTIKEATDPVTLDCAGKLWIEAGGHLTLPALPT